MFAIVSGHSLGLNLTSSGVLGSVGVYGSPTTGQGGERVYVNAATGNLMTQQWVGLQTLRARCAD